LRNDSRDYRVFLIVSRQYTVDASFSTVICAPVYTKYDGFTTPIEVDEGLKHDNAVYCDELISIRKTLLTDYDSSLSPAKMEEVNAALRIALAVA
jgi:mRNA interferase MazF